MSGMCTMVGILDVIGLNLSDPCLQVTGCLCLPNARSTQLLNCTLQDTKHERCCNSGHTSLWRKQDSCEWAIVDTLTFWKLQRCNFCLSIAVPVPNKVSWPVILIPGPLESDAGTPNAKRKFLHVAACKYDFCNLSSMSNGKEQGVAQSKTTRVSPDPVQWMRSPWTCERSSISSRTQRATQVIEISDPFNPCVFCLCPSLYNLAAKTFYKSFLSAVIGLWFRKLVLFWSSPWVEHFKASWCDARTTQEMNVWCSCRGWPQHNLCRQWSWCFFWSSVIRKMCDCSSVCPKSLRYITPDALIQGLLVWSGGTVRRTHVRTTGFYSPPFFGVVGPLTFHELWRFVKQCGQIHQKIILWAPCVHHWDFQGRQWDWTRWLSSVLLWFHNANTMHHSTVCSVPHRHPTPHPGHFTA